MKNNNIKSLDFSTSEDRLKLQMSSMFAQYESAKRGEAIKRGLARKKAETISEHEQD